MNNNIYYILKANIGAGKLNDLKTLAEEFSKITIAEPGALAYEWSLSSNNEVLHIYERFADTTAALAHLENIGAELHRLMDLVEVTAVECYGKASDSFKKAVEDLPVTYFDTFCGFSK